MDPYLNVLWLPLTTDKQLDNVERNLSKGGGSDERRPRTATRYIYRPPVDLKSGIESP